MIPIKNYEDYLIDRDSSIYSIKRKIYLKLHLDKRYYRITLCKNGKMKSFLLHKLLATHFIPNPENKSEVNHKNSITTDNSISNLEWVTRSENNKYAFKYGLNSNLGEKNNHSKLTKINIINIRQSNKSQKELSIIYNTSRQNIWRILHRKTWNHI